jgi:hypothetical protein
MLESFPEDSSMATRRWRGTAEAVAQVSTVQITAYDSATTYILTVNNKTVSVPGNTDVNTTASDLADAWNASTEPEFAEVTASVSTDTVTLTGDTAGLPFTATSSVSGGTGTIGSVTESTAATGPNHWNDAANWDGGAVPVNSDDVWVETSEVPIKYGLDQSGVTLASLHIPASFAGDGIGLPELNEEGSASYREYRDTHLQISATVLDIGDGPGPGCGRLKIDTGSNACTATIHSTGTSLEADLETLQYLGAHASNVCNAYGGDIAIAGYGGETSTIPTLRLRGNANVRCGSGVTLTTVEQFSGTLEINSAFTTLTMSGGTCLVAGSGVPATITVDAGLLLYQTTGTLSTAMTVGSGGVVDCRGNLASKTITPTINLYSGASWIDSNAVVTYTAGFTLNRCRLAEVNLDLGDNRTLTVS